MVGELSWPMNSRPAWTHWARLVGLTRRSRTVPRPWLYTFEVFFFSLSLSLYLLLIV